MVDAARSNAAFSILSLLVLPRCNRAQPQTHARPSLLLWPRLLLQMHKEVPPPRTWRPLVIRHQAFVARVYVAADKQSLSSKSCIQRPGMHDMGAISGYGRSSRATSNVTTGSVSNASFGTAAQEPQQDDDAGSKPDLQKGAAGEEVLQVNGIKQEQPTVINGHSQQPQQQHADQLLPLQAKVEQQEQDSDEMLLIAPAGAQQEQPLIGVNIAAGGSGAELLMHGAAGGIAAGAAAPMNCS